MNTRKWHEHMKTAAVTLLVTALFALANGAEDHIVKSARIGAPVADLIAAAPDPCYCTETCR